MVRLGAVSGFAVTSPTAPHTVIEALFPYMKSRQARNECGMCNKREETEARSGRTLGRLEEGAQVNDSITERLSVELFKQAPVSRDQALLLHRGTHTTLLRQAQHRHRRSKASLT
uniref:Uncharacterized protein n=1 Tax=Knipowitschia caucasica TaxID=637954 RepID=A0AAV2IWK7_KNICA